MTLTSNARHLLKQAAFGQLRAPGTDLVRYLHRRGWIRCVGANRFGPGFYKLTKKGRWVLDTNNEIPWRRKRRKPE